METKIDKRGRVVIPAEVRRRMGLEPGMKLEVVEKDFEVRLIPTGGAGSLAAPNLRSSGRRVKG